MSIYRIRRRQPTSVQEEELLADAEAGTAGADTHKETIESYFEKAIKLIPADVVAAYLALRNLWHPIASDGVNDALGEAMHQWVLPIGGLAAVILLRILGTSSKFASFKGIQWPVVAVSSVAYIAWILSFNDPVLNIDAPDPRFSATLLMLVSIIGPSFVRRLETNA